MPDWDHENNDKVAMSNDPKKGTWGLGDDGWAQATLYTARATDEYYLDLIIRTAHGRTIKIVDKVRFGPRFIKRVDMEVVKMDASARTKQAVMQRLVDLLGKNDCELDNMLRNHMSRVTFKEDESTWRADLRADLYRYYGN